MAPPRREPDRRAELDLIELQAAARIAESNLWERAYRALDAGELTGERVAQVLDVSPATVWRRVRAISGAGPARQPRA